LWSKEDNYDDCGARRIRGVYVKDMGLDEDIT